VKNFFNPESALEQGNSLVKNVGNQAKVTVQAAASQITGNDVISQVGQGAKPDSAPSADPVSQNQDFIKDLYGVSQNKPASPSDAAQTSPTNDPDKLKQAREALQLLQRQHNESYYVPTFEAPKPEEQPVTEKLEEAKQREIIELNEKEKKKPQDIAKIRAQNKTEMFRGASG
jgi:hypothetical protein